MNHYVYAWYNTETLEVFYIGKGSLGRDLYDSNFKLIKEFGYFGECAEYLIENGITDTCKETVAIRISEKKKNGLSYKGFYFK